VYDFEIVKAVRRLFKSFSPVFLLFDLLKDLFGVFGILPECRGLGKLFLFPDLF
jgi:hypothetical protein